MESVTMKPTWTRGVEVSSHLYSSTWADQSNKKQPNSLDVQPVSLMILRLKQGQMVCRSSPTPAIEGPTINEIQTTRYLRACSLPEGTNEDLSQTLKQPQTRDTEWT